MRTKLTRKEKFRTYFLISSSYCSLFLQLYSWFFAPNICSAQGREKQKRKWKKKEYAFQRLIFRSCFLHLSEGLWYKTWLKASWAFDALAGFALSWMVQSPISVLGVLKIVVLLNMLKSLKLVYETVIIKKRKIEITSGAR